MSESKHTPGPWRWELSLTSKAVRLAGGTPRFDTYVMDFERWGMQRASPRFYVDGLMYPAKEFAEIVKGREHHADWFQSINHPDAKLIASAPDMYEMLLETKALLEPLANNPASEVFMNKLNSILTNLLTPQTR